MQYRRARTSGRGLVDKACCGWALLKGWRGREMRQLAKRKPRSAGFEDVTLRELRAGEVLTSTTSRRRRDRRPSPAR
jgi:hypothetical protein